jgi:hypothetical protein
MISSLTAEISPLVTISILLGCQPMAMKEISKAEEVILSFNLLQFFFLKKFITHPSHQDIYIGDET